MYTPVAAVDAPDYVLVGSIALFVGAVLHLARVLKASRSFRAATAHAILKLDVLGWSFLVLGTFLCAVGAWALCFDVVPTRV